MGFDWQGSPWAFWYVYERSGVAMAWVPVRNG